MVVISNRGLSYSKARVVNTSVYAYEYCAQGGGVHAVRKLVHNKGVSFLYDDVYKSIRYLCSYSSSSIPEAMAFRVVVHEQEASTIDVLT